MSADHSFSSERDLARSEEEEKLLKDIREEKDRLWLEIQELRRQIIDIDNELAALDEANDEEIRAEKEKQRIIRTGRNKFNTKPKEGIKFLQSNNIIGESADEVAQYLLKGELLNKRAIGDYLGEGKEFNIEVLKRFIAQHDFKGKSIVDALRAFLWSFHLPGEAQKIDRIMELFAQRFVDCNPGGELDNADTAYVLSYAIIMLHTSLHNPSVKDKPTPDRFISMNRGINNGQNLPPEFLTELYESVKKEQFKIPDGEGNLAETFFNPEREGWLTKEGGKYKSKHKRWFILKDGMLYYFKQPTDDELIGSIPLVDPGLRVRAVQDPKAAPFCFELFSESGVIKAWKKDSDGKPVPGNHDVYRLLAGSDEEREQWMHCIEASIQGSVYDAFQQKKRRIISVQGLELPGFFD